ncbi:nadp-dependent leukotriene b4 12-hydroxydehydrogenase [Ophiostoma piceae UAMH 11346]|uniref:Dehydrogenase FUB6 n=1 Tax=Ophiostoma piceae (strain UAMH 11346) TaxID=1262450 RepID=S3BX21_OPHP1|nr:nadp-dependent leukotriene b4 12-hydroxydehydrogenase [Ophiostoma piceae UAMH 11346]
MSRTNTSVVLAERPEANIIPGQTFRVETSPAPTAADLKDGDLLCEALYLSLDPAMRGWINDKPSYLPPVQIGAVMRGVSVARVLASKSKKAAEGDIVVAFTGWTEVAIVNERWVENPFAAMPAELRSRLQPTDLVNTLGMTGLTAYWGIMKVAEGIKPTDTVVISGAAGATGSVVGQIAKILGAKRIIGIAGSDDKTKWLVDELGFDEALNYKDADFAAKFRAATKDQIDVYWDNVGGEILDLALGRANTHARFVMCGGISQYNSASVQGPKNILQVVVQRIKMQGFIVLDYAAENAKAVGDLAKWTAEGKLKSKAHIVKGGLNVAEKSLVDLFSGINTGKLLVEVKALDEAPKL